MLNSDLVDHVTRYSASTQRLKESFNYEKFIGLKPFQIYNYSSLFKKLENKVYFLPRTINILKFKNIFSDDPVSQIKFEKGIQKIETMKSFLEDLDGLNNMISEYFQQWINKYQLDEEESFKPLFNSIEIKLNEFNSVLDSLYQGGEVLEIISKYSDLYCKLTPLVNHINRFEPATNLEIAESLNLCINDKKFDSIIDREALYNLDSVKENTKLLHASCKKNIENIVKNNPSIFNSKFNTIIKKLNEQGLESKNFFEECKNTLIEKFKEFKGHEAMTQAAIYGEQSNNNSIVSFLTNKNNDSMIDYSFEFTNAILNKVIVFKDTSVGYIQNDKYYDIDPTDVDSYKTLRRNSFISLISQELMRKPTIRNLFINKYISDQVPGEYVIVTLNNYLNHEQILKNKGIHLDVFKEKSFEAIDDVIASNVRQYKAERMLNRSLSNKYRNLYDEDKVNITNIMIDLIDSGMNESMLKDFVIKKIGAIKTGAELFDNLRKLKNSLDEFDEDILRKKAKYLDVKVLEIDSNIFVFEVKNYEQSKSLGSPSWCIVRDKIYFDDYTSKNNKQYFIYDFNKDSSNIESMIGFTLNVSGSITARHYKNDDYISDDFPILEKAQLKVILNDNSYNPSDRIKKLIEEMNNNKQNISNLRLNI